MTALGSFVVPASHPCLPGHFPGRPVVPGVVLLDEAAALILAAAPGRRVAGFPALRFMHPVLAGQEVAVSLEGASFTCAVAGRAVLRGTVTLAVAAAA